MFCDLCVVTVVLVGVLFSSADGRPGFYEQHGLSLGSYSGGGGNSYGGGSSYASPGEGLGNYGSDQNDLESHQSGGSDGGDYHHGVSVVSLGTQKGPTFDLTKHSGGDNHHGLYGGSFVSGKYEGSDGEGHHGVQGPHYTSVQGYGDQDEHSALLTASLSSGYEGFDGGSYH